MTLNKARQPVIKVLGLAMAAMISGFVHADTVTDIQTELKSLQQQVGELQQKLDKANTSQSGTKAASSNGPVNIGPVSLTINGFIEAAAIYRNRDEVADMGSKWAPIYANSDAYHVGESRLSSRQSRLSFLFQGPEINGGKAEAYYEMDFLGVGTTSNSTESNSYVPRTRQIYLDYASDNGLQLLAGQAWSLATQNKTGIALRKENVPMTIEAQYVPGFTWTRNPQLRLTDKFSDAFSAAISLESPQSISTGLKPGGAISTLPGGSTMNSTNNYSLDSMPDVIAKAALDPGFGHYEVLGMERRFKDRVDPGVTPAPINGSNHETTGHGIGANMILPLVPKTLDFQASVLNGTGIGRYGSSQLPDFTYNSTGTLSALRERQVLVGLIAHATPDLDFYSYYGKESADDNYTTAGGKFYGYGNPGNSNAGCDAATGTCTANVKTVRQWTVGTWYKFYRGETGGYMTAGLQYSHTDYDIFRDTAGVGPHSDMNVMMASLRYFPSQK